MAKSISPYHCKCFGCKTSIPAILEFNRKYFHFKATINIILTFHCEYFLNSKVSNKDHTSVEIEGGKVILCVVNMLNILSKCHIDENKCHILLNAHKFWVEFMKLERCESLMYDKERFESLYFDKNFIYLVIMLHEYVNCKYINLVY